MKRVVVVACCLLAAWACAGADDDAPLLRIEVEQPRAFGWRLGDVFERRLSIDVPHRLKLDEASLPKVGRPGGVAELRAIERSREAIDGGERLRLVLRYQLFVSPEQARTFELRGFRLRFSGPPRDRTARSTDDRNDETALVEAWPLAAAPLAPPDASPRTGLGELRPDAPLPLPDSAPARRLIVWAAMAALLLGYLAHVYLGERWWARRRRPFARAYRDLARLDLARGDALPAAFRRLHRAFDESAGRAMFAAGAGAFAAEGSRWAPPRAEIGDFFERSRAAFFDGGPADAADGPRLLALARALRDVERGAA